MADVTAQIVFLKADGYGSWLSPSCIVDAAANKFQAYVDVEGNTCPAIVRKTDPGGAVVGEWQVTVPGYKLDGVALHATGADLLVEVTGHVAAAQPRALCYAEAAIPGVFAPYHAGEFPGAMAGAFEGGNMSDPQYTPEEIAAAVADELAFELGSNPRTVLKRNIQNTDVVTARDKIHALTTENIKDTLYQFTLDRVYEALAKEGVWDLFRRLDAFLTK